MKERQFGQVRQDRNRTEIFDVNTAEKTRDERESCFPRKGAEQEK
jgi:hypothetical protein